MPKFAVLGERERKTSCRKQLGREEAGFFHSPAQPERARCQNFSVTEFADGKRQGSRDGTACYGLPGFFESSRVTKLQRSPTAPRGRILRLRHLQASARELIREAARERGVRAQVRLLPNAATPCHHLPAAKVCGNGRSGQGMVGRSGAEREGDAAVSRVAQPHAFP